MQILLGASETVVKIRSKTVSIEYIQHFINNHFDNKILGTDTILIPESTKNPHKRVFLLKWLYTLYAKRTNNHIPKLKELLLNRQHKPIRIYLAQKIEYKITYLIKENIIKLEISPKNIQIQKQIANYFSINYQNLSIELNNNNKILLKKFLNPTTILNFTYQHIYDKEKVETLLSNEEQQKDSMQAKISQAYKIFGIHKINKNILRKKYKKLAKKYHPDRVATHNMETINFYTKKFQDIVNAYELLLKLI